MKSWGHVPLAFMSADSSSYIKEARASCHLVIREMPNFYLRRTPQPVPPMRYCFVISFQCDGATFCPPYKPNMPANICQPFHPAIPRYVSACRLECLPILLERRLCFDQACSVLAQHVSKTACGDRVRVGLRHVRVCATGCPATSVDAQIVPLPLKGMTHGPCISR